MKTTPTLIRPNGIRGFVARILSSPAATTSAPKEKPSDPQFYAAYLAARIDAAHWHKQYVEERNQHFETLCEKNNLEMEASSLRSEVRLLTIRLTPPDWEPLIHAPALTSTPPPWITETPEAGSEQGGNIDNHGS